KARSTGLGAVTSHEHRTRRGPGASQIAEQPLPNFVTKATSTAHRPARRSRRTRLGKVQQILGELLGRDLSLLDEAAINELLDDFTTADLHDADLHATDLSGVRWSERTWWPLTIDVQSLENQSQETLLGSGIYIVRSGHPPVRDFADQT
ncbi:hypothetical protein ACFWBT_38350, partial [Streptomyces sp. NPDC060027]